MLKERFTGWLEGLDFLPDWVVNNIHIIGFGWFLLGVVCFFLVVRRYRFFLFIACLFLPVSFLLFPFVFLIRAVFPRGSGEVREGSDSGKDVPSPFAFRLPVRGRARRHIQITNPFRGTFITGGAGAGKSRSLIEPIIYQAMENGFTGLLYDYENPVLADHVYTAFDQVDTKVEDFYINFTDLTRSHRVNPLDPGFMVSSSYAREYASTVLMNLMPETIGKRKDFWIRSAESLFSAVMWFLREHHPGYCTLPHAVSLVLTEDLGKLLTVVSEDEECAGMVASIKGGLRSENQTAGVLATAQNALAGINTPEVFWVLSGHDLTLDLNDRERPKFLAVGNDPDLVDTYSPVISLILSAALKMMNRQGRHHSLFLVDELPTLYIPNLDRIPATARKNRIATVLSVQDYSQLEDKYGEKKAEVITSVLSNQFFGNSKNPKTTERVSRLYGRYDQAFVTESEGRSAGTSSGSGIFGSTSRGSSVNRSTSIQQRNRVRPQDIANLDKGEFYGSIVESVRSEFKVQFAGEEHVTKGIPPFRDVSPAQVKANYARIKEEARTILNGGMTDGEVEVGIEF